MNVIEFNKKNIIKEYSHGMESTIYLYKCNGSIVILKKFNKEIKYGDRVETVNDSVFENKRKKLEIISESKLFKDEVKILDLVYENNEFIGYTMMPLLELENFDLFTPRKKKIYVLKELRKKVDKFNQNNVYIGDFNVKNIFIGNNKIVLCDLDNIRIDDLDFDLKNCFQQSFLSRYKNIDNIDNYSFNLFTISVMQKTINSFVWKTLNEKGLPHMLNTKENRDIIESMRNMDENYKKRYLIDNIRKF